MCDRVVGFQTVFQVLALLALILGTLAMIWVVVPGRIAALRRRLDELEAEARAARAAVGEIDALRRRVQTLEARLGERESPPVAPPAPAVPDARLRPARGVPAAGVSQVPASPVAVAAPSARPAAAAAPPVSTPSAPPDAAAAAATSGWELIVGANWLNRVGVLAIVIGIALGVLYTVGHTGPLGRIAIGYAASLVLLGGGTWLERRPAYRSYAAGLVAGGWAGTYFTTYAAHAVEGARVIEGDVVATAALVAVAAGLVAYSLRYRSQTVTGFAYLVAYATLALTPLSSFALVASVPLSASLLIVAQRFGWTHMATLGVVSTYGIFALRGAILPGPTDAASAAPYLTLAAYWLTFETGDVLALRSPHPTPRAPLFALNALGFVGASLLQLPEGEPRRLSALLAMTAVAYLASAIVRAQLLGASRAEELTPQTFSGASQGAIGVAAGLTLWAIGLRFAGSREVIGLLFTTEVLFVTGVAFADRIVRVFGAGAAVVTAIGALRLVISDASVRDWPWSMHGWVPALVLVSIVFYVNREILRSQRIEPSRLEWGYAPAASLLALQVLTSEIAAPYLGLSLMAGAALLIEAGLRRAVEYRYQAYALGGIGLLAIVGRQLGDSAYLVSPSPTAEAWRTLPLVAALAYVSAARLGWRSIGQASNVELKLGAAGFASAGTLAVVLLEGRVAAPLHVGPAWAITALLLAFVAGWRQWPALVWQAYALVWPAALASMQPILTGPPRTASASAIVWAVVVIALLFTVGVLGRRAAATRTQGSGQVEAAVRLAVLVAASACVVVLIFRQADPSFVTLALAFAGVALVGAGLPLAERALRLAGLAIFGIGILRLFTSDLVRLQGLTRIISFIVSGMVLLGVSWVYTRFREEIRRFL